MLPAIIDKGRKHSRHGTRILVLGLLAALAAGCGSTIPNRDPTQG